MARAWVVLPPEISVEKVTVVVVLTHRSHLPSICESCPQVRGAWSNAAFFLPSFLLSAVKKVCPADPRIRVNCGYPGITAKECTSRKCCFRAHPAGVPWCFYHRTVEEGNISHETLPVCPHGYPAAPKQDKLSSPSQWGFRVPRAWVGRGG